MHKILKIIEEETYHRQDFFILPIRRAGPSTVGRVGNLYATSLDAQIKLSCGIFFIMNTYNYVRLSVMLEKLSKSRRDEDEKSSVLQQSFTVVIQVTNDSAARSYNFTVFLLDDEGADAY